MLPVRGVGLASVLLALAALVSSCSVWEEPESAPVQADNEWRAPFDNAPKWSPDGQRIAFSRGADETLRLLEVRSGRMTVLSDGVRSGGNALWSRDGQRLAYVRGSDRTLRVADVRTGKSIELLDSVSGLGVGAWSPDQRSLAVVSMRDGTNSPRCFGDGSCTELYVVNAAGGKHRRLTDNLTYEKDPVWSPDGKRIAVLSAHDLGSQHIWRDVRVASLVDGSEKLVTNDGRVEWSAEWRDSNTLLIETDRGSRSEVSVTTSRQRQLPPRKLAFPSVVAKQSGPVGVRSALDSTLAYRSTRDRNGRTCWEASGGSDGPGCYPNAELYLRLPSGRRVRVTHSRVDETELAWSPDGRTLAFQSGGKLMLVDHDGGGLRALITK